MNSPALKCDILIVGGGVVGTALLYTLSKYTNVKNICLIEKYSDFGLVNSASTQNSQTLHFGDIETNYTLEKAKSVKRYADLVMKYLENNKSENNDEKLFSKYSKMVLAVGKKQVEDLKTRYTLFSPLFPNLRMITKDEIGKIEPRVVEGRNADEEILALITDDGYTVDYGRLSHSFANKAKELNKEIKIHLSTRLSGIVKNPDSYLAITDKSEIEAKVVVVAAGSYSLLIAKSLGYGKDFSILSMAGSFYTGPKILNGKVYTIQVAKLPFAAIHGDPEVHNENITRFGPTAKPIFLLERYNRSTFVDYWRTFGRGIQPVLSLLKITFDKVFLSYILMNFLYDFPIIGKRLFINQIRKIVPNVKLNDIKFAKGIGGTRPQTVNNKTHKLEMGEAKLVGDKIIFNITPSPGASTCLGNAYSDTLKIMDFLENKFTFDKAAFEKDLG
jgi:malate dehydrogenase (quinone)